MIYTVFPEDSDRLPQDFPTYVEAKAYGDEAEYVAFVFNTYLARKSISEVAALAKEKGYCGKRGSLPSPSSIRVILTRPVYCGYNVFCGELYEGNHTPLVSPTQFNRVQSLLKRQGKISGRERKTDYYLVPEK